jgi:hypothetical protein
MDFLACVKGYCKLRDNNIYSENICHPHALRRSLKVKIVTAMATDGSPVTYNLTEWQLNSSGIRTFTGKKTLKKRRKNG